MTTPRNDGSPEDLAATRPFATELEATIADHSGLETAPIEARQLPLIEATIDQASSPRALDPNATQAHTVASHGAGLPGTIATNPDVTCDPPELPRSLSDLAIPERPFTDRNTAASRYRMLRPHAKGGLGEVFVALDEELGREVALKEIQERHADRIESRSRFLLEAEVTGGLEHPGIVPVYGLGRYADGRPYYAMRFIHGSSLQEAIAAFHEADKSHRDPGERELELRQLLSRFIDVCDAMAYAHARGIIHRDIKPANIMVGSFGETLVVDWGLAKALDRPDVDEITNLRPLRPMSASGSSETLYGTAIGTPHYMSPEQADGRLDILGPAADIYSLGATLYTLLTGTTAFEAQKVTVLLDKVRQGDLIPPRTRKSNVPRPLEAICLKAMAREPAERYPTVTALASDIEHWLADEPVSVYREPLPARMARWAKRHKTLVTSSAALLLAATTALAIGSVLIKREQQRTEENFLLARAAVDQMLTQLGEVDLADVPQMEPVRKRMLGQALLFYQTFLKKRANDLTVRQETTRARLRLAGILEMLGDYSEAELGFGRAVAEFETLSKTHPDNVEIRRDLSRAEHSRGLLLRKLNRFSESEHAFRSALVIRKQLVQENPKSADDREAEKNTVYHLGALLARMGGTRAEVEMAYQEAIDEQKTLTTQHPDRPSYRSDLARYMNNQGILLARNEPRSAEKIYREAMAIQQELADRSPTVAAYQWQLARTLCNLGTPLEFDQQFEEAATTYRKALSRLQQLADAFPTVPDYQSELAIVNSNLGMVLRRKKNAVAEAEQHLRTALGILGQLAERFPKRPDFRLKTAQIRRALAIVQANSNRKADAEDGFRTSLATLQSLAQEYPQVPEYQSEVAIALDSLALLLDANGQVPQAVELVQEAILHQEKAFKGATRNAYYQQYLMTDYQYLEKMLGYLGHYERLARAAEGLLVTLPDEPKALYRAARLQALAASLVARDPQLAADVKGAKIRATAEAAMTGLKRAIGQGYRPPDGLNDRVFDGLREREDFQRLKSSLQTPVRPA